MGVLSDEFQYGTGRKSPDSRYKSMYGSRSSSGSGSIGNATKRIQKKKVIQDLKGGLGEGAKDYLADKGKKIALEAAGIDKETGTGGAISGGLDAFIASGGQPWVAVAGAVLGGLAGRSARKDAQRKHDAKWKAKEKEALAEGGERKLAAMRKMKGALRSSLNRPSRVRAMSRME